MTQLFSNLLKDTALFLVASVFEVTFFQVYFFDSIWLGACSA